eukprot:CAMPEP_0179014956 /NCGR_PEP_ID=MMETSP0796-20121207/2534_1 /TAXON_ID=73915 /ORGANISM="Pyrodinium bahamense, Strain pbaha01" /LENGTH=74 /DNA_ID=CAMNT_0020710557 /DNA_START=33 /DNA_END=257 /DNA_ORIENTATION=-
MPGDQSPGRLSRWAAGAVLLKPFVSILGHHKPEFDVEIAVLGRVAPVWHPLANYPQHAEGLRDPIDGKGDLTTV